MKWHLQIIYTWQPYLFFHIYNHLSINYICAFNTYLYMKDYTRHSTNNSLMQI